jgi:hypothetical protein
MAKPTECTTKSGEQIIAHEIVYGRWQWVARKKGQRDYDNRFPTKEEALAWAEEREVVRTVISMDQSHLFDIKGLTLAEAEAVTGRKSYTTNGMWGAPWACCEYALQEDGTMQYWRANWDSSG